MKNPHSQRSNEISSIFISLYRKYKFSMQHRIYSDDFCCQIVKEQHLFLKTRLDNIESIIINQRNSRMNKQNYLIEAINGIASMWKKLFFNGLRIISRSKDKNITYEDLPTEGRRYDQSTVYESWEKAKKESKFFTSTSWKVVGFLLRTLWMQLSFLFIMTFVMKTIMFYRPIALNNLLSIGEEVNQDESYFGQYACILSYVLFELIHTILQEIHSMNRVQYHMLFNNICKTLIFEKILRLSSSSRKYLETGVLTSYYNQDCGIIGHGIYQAYTLIVCPFTLFFATYQLCGEIGWIGVLAPALIAITLLSQSYRRKLTQEKEKENSKIGDKKSKIINEYISGMKILKYYGWEEIAKEKILNIREKQSVLHNLLHKLYHVGNMILSGVPSIFALFVFIYFSYVENQPMSLKKFLVVSAIIDILRGPVFDIYYNINDLTRIKISLTKFSNFLDSEEKQMEEEDSSFPLGNIYMKSCKFQYENRRARQQENKRKLLIESAKSKEEKQRQKEEKDGNDEKQKLLEVDEQIPVVLEVPSLEIESGQFIGVCGKVGSGKSTLINGIIGEVYQSEGKTKKNGSIAYCPQIAWLKNDTIKENIVFGAEFDQTKYDDVISRCELLTDLKLLDKGDSTIVGQKGVKLSGGQKQRISIARCLYSGADIFLFDDCLSALDAHVGKNIFENVIQHLHSQNKTIIFVLNALDYLIHCDRKVFVKDKVARVFEEIKEMKKADEQFFKSIEHHEEKKGDKTERKKQMSEEQVQKDELNEIVSSSDNKSQNSIETSAQEKMKEEEKDVKQNQDDDDDEDQVEKVSVPKVIYLFVRDNFSKSCILPFLSIAFFSISHLIYRWWLGLWAEDSSQDTIIYYLVGSFVIVVFQIFLDYYKIIEMRKIGLKAGQLLHKKYLNTIFKTPMTWFDGKPSGEILDRAMKYQNRVDHEIIWAIHWFLEMLTQFIVAMVLIIRQSFINLLLVVIMFFLFYQLNQVVMKPARLLNKMMNKQGEKRSSFLQETTTGIQAIRAFQRNDLYKKNQVQINDKILTIRYNQHFLRGSFNTILMNFTSNIILGTISFIIIQNLQTDPEQSKLWISLTLNQSIHIGGIISCFFHCRIWLTEICSALNKIYQWVLENPSEKSFTEPKPTENWLEKGTLKVDDISYKYRPELPLVLKNLSFSINENEKIGVVGRTGSGKSTLTLGMLRILEVSDNKDGSKGSITMNGTDISEIGLHHLRHEVAMIPQDPLLFSGTLKSNIDPFGKFSDEKIMECLKRVHIWDDLKEEKEEQDPIKRKLNSKIDEEGSNYSLGQRQLLCLARALIRNPKVLLMDEATASIDLKTDEMIQKMISEEFKETTVITIAHRLNTIINYDKILVLDKGQVQEFASPVKLVENEDSFLGRMIRKVGPEYTEKMINLAHKKQNHE